MDILPTDIILILLDVLPMCDKRNLIRCTVQFNKLTFLMQQYQSKFLKSMAFVWNISLTSLEKYTLEYVYDGYVNIMPKHYINNHNKILYAYSDIYYHAGKENHTELIKLLVNHNKKYIQEIINGLATNNHLTTLMWIREMNFDWDYETCAYAATKWSFRTFTMGSCKWL